MEVSREATGVDGWMLGVVSAFIEATGDGTSGGGDDSDGADVTGPIL